jgi:hypothetical protein
VNATEGGPAYTWSSIASTHDFVNGNMPMPIIIALERAPGEENIGKDDTRSFPILLFISTLVLLLT